jgi:cytochrome b
MPRNLREIFGATLLQLLRELIKGLAEKQKSIHPPCGAVVLKAKWSAYH